MARLFITPREMNYFSDLAKEVIKDISGQKIYYYPISEVKTKTHSLYNEAIEKVFDDPIAIDALVDAKVGNEVKMTKFGSDTSYQIEVYVHYRDLVDKGIEIVVGDFFSYSDVFYEVSNLTTMKKIFGQAEHNDGIQILGTKVRDGQFKAKLLGPTDIRYNDPDAVQTKFVQQRGYAENSEGPTGDKRELIENEVLEQPLTGPREISERGAKSDNSDYVSSFYDEED